MISPTGGHFAVEPHLAVAPVGASVDFEPEKAADPHEKSGSQSNPSGGGGGHTSTGNQGICAALPPPEGFTELRLLAEMLLDAQKLRISTSNRLASGSVDPDAAASVLDHIRQTEAMLDLTLRRTYRRVAPEPIRRWQKGASGIGEHLLALLLGTIGDPASRSLPQLRSYCGHGAPGRRRRGMTQDEARALGNPRAKVVVHLLAISCIKHRQSPYRSVYDIGRSTYASRIEADGASWSLGHQHAAALRLTGKAILLDLWWAAAVDRYLGPTS